VSWGAVDGIGGGGGSCCLPITAAAEEEKASAAEGHAKATQSQYFSVMIYNQILVFNSLTKSRVKPTFNYTIAVEKQKQALEGYRLSIIQPNDGLINLVTRRISHLDEKGERTTRAFSFCLSLEISE
jgi:hypothetical protein